MERNITQDFANQIFGNWKVIELDEQKSNETGRIYWKCQCQCGCNTIRSFRSDVVPTVSAGCSQAPSVRAKICPKCGKSFFPKKYGHTRRYCFECVPDGIYSNGASMRRLIKKWALDYKGSHCELCGYNKCTDALEFHHLDPDQKDFSISDRDIKLDWGKIKNELDKCILICANCHRELHAHEKERK